MQHLTIAGRQASAICLGCARFGSQQGEDEAFALLDRFVELGGNSLDTAHVYGAWAPDGANGGCGNSEVVIGRWLRARGCRERVFLGTKGAHPDFASGASAMDAASVARHLEESLDHLQVDRIDLYWLHRDQREVPVAEILGWFEEPLRRGRIGAIGCSHWRHDRLAEALRLADERGLPRIAASQIAGSLARQRHGRSENRHGEQLALDPDGERFHRETGLPLFAYHAQAGGFFASKYDGCDFLAEDFPKPGLARTYASDANLRRRELAREIGARHGRTANQVALAWLLDRPYPSSAVVGPRDDAQLSDTMAAAELELTEDERRRLTRGE